MVGVVRVLRLRLPIQDRLRRMKMVKNCFQGNELVEALLQNFHCARNEVRTLPSYTHRMPTYFYCYFHFFIDSIVIV